MSGADWIVVQYNYLGNPINCWKLVDTSITNEQNSDGIYWQTTNGHLQHISGWYSRIQVNNGDFIGAAKLMGVNLNQCDGRYLKAEEYPTNQEKMIDAGIEENPFKKVFSD